VVPRAGFFFCWNEQLSRSHEASCLDGKSEASGMDIYGCVTWHDTARAAAIPGCIGVESAQYSGGGAELDRLHQHARAQILLDMSGLSERGYRDGRLTISRFVVEAVISHCGVEQ
jgi:hypothetical protein